MSIPWKERLIDLMSAPYSLFGIGGETKVQPAQPAPEKPYQKPGKDGNHPGDEAAVRASTEKPEPDAIER